MRRQLSYVVSATPRPVPCARCHHQLATGTEAVSDTYGWSHKECYRERRQAEREKAKAKATPPSRPR